jgi:serine/threonine-protein kinase
VLRLGTPVTFALYSARLRLSEQTGVRRRFVLLVRELSLDALPMLRAGLARLATHRDRPVAVDLAIDLLRASPRVLDVEDGALAAVYVTDSPPALASAAADALVGFWGARAKPLLLGLLDSADASVIVTAIDGLRGLQLIDELAIAQIARAARAAPCAAVRAAARAAFMDTSGSVSVLADRAACALRLTP